MRTTTRPMADRLTIYEPGRHCSRCGAYAEVKVLHRPSDTMVCPTCAARHATPVCRDSACLSEATVNIDGERGRHCDTHWNPAADEMLVDLSGWRR